MSSLYQKTADAVLNELNAVVHSIDDISVEELKKLLLQSDKIFFVGVGRVLLSVQSIVKRLNHIGINAHYVGEITEPAITENDLLVVCSASGTTIYPLAIARKAKKIGVPVIHIGSNPNSELRDIADFMIRIPARTKLSLDDEIDSCQPMTSLFEQSLLIFGDILCKMIFDDMGIDMKEVWKNHANLE
jgi:6-phospho-3-hexuloisomerase